MLGHGGVRGRRFDDPWLDGRQRRVGEASAGSASAAAVPPRREPPRCVPATL